MPSCTAVLGIRFRSGFLMPCIRLMWFFNITQVANIVFVSVQYLEIRESYQNSKKGYLNETRLTH